VFSLLGRCHCELPRRLQRALVSGVELKLRFPCEWVDHGKGIVVLPRIPHEAARGARTGFAFQVDFGPRLLLRNVLKTLKRYHHNNNNNNNSLVETLPMSDAVPISPSQPAAANTASGGAVPIPPASQSEAAQPPPAAPGANTASGGVAEPSTTTSGDAALPIGGVEVPASPVPGPRVGPALLSPTGRGFGDRGRGNGRGRGVSDDRRGGRGGGRGSSILTQAPALGAAPTDPDAGPQYISGTYAQAVVHNLPSSAPSSTPAQLSNPFNAVVQRNAVNSDYDATLLRLTIPRVVATAARLSEVEYPMLPRKDRPDQFLPLSCRTTFVVHGSVAWSDARVFAAVERGYILRGARHAKEIRIVRRGNNRPFIFLIGMQPTALQGPVYERVTIVESVHGADPTTVAMCDAHTYVVGTLAALKQHELTTVIRSCISPREGDNALYEGICFSTTPTPTGVPLLKMPMWVLASPAAASRRARIHFKNVAISQRMRHLQEIVQLLAQKEVAAEALIMGSDGVLAIQGCWTRELKKIVESVPNVERVFTELPIRRSLPRVVESSVDEVNTQVETPKADERVLFGAVGNAADLVLPISQEMWQALAASLQGRVMSQNLALARLIVPVAHHNRVCGRRAHGVDWSDVPFDL
jgi:hypothetical protein